MYIYTYLYIGCWATSLGVAAALGVQGIYLLYVCVYIWMDVRTYVCTGWPRLIGSPKLQIIFHKRATKYRSLLRKMTHKDKGSCESSPPCMYDMFWRLYVCMLYVCMNVSMYVCMYVYMYACMYICSYVFVCICTYIPIQHMHTDTGCTDVLPLLIL